MSATRRRNMERIRSACAGEAFGCTGIAAPGFVCCFVRMNSRMPSARFARRASPANSGATYAARIRIVAARAIAARPAACQAPECAVSTSSTIAVSSSPMMRNTAPSSTSSTVRQFCASDRRCCGLRNFAAPRPVTSPATTAATSPEAPKCSAGIEARNGIVKEMTVFTVGFITRARTRRLTQPMTTPITAASTTE